MEKNGTFLGFMHKKEEKKGGYESDHISTLMSEEVTGYKLPCSYSSINIKL